MDEPPARFGRYELIRRLDGGGMGDVYLARARGPERVQKVVVLKRLRRERLVDEAARARFVDEARVAVSLSHPHVVPVFEFGELDGEYFLVMEWLRGGDLLRVAGPGRAPLGWAATALLGAQLCDALAYVHGRKDRRGARLVHGDVTPRNVLLSPDGHALLADFGLSRFAAQGRAGTTRYLAPEQARGESIDGRADLYALALVLSEAVTGEPAYDLDPALAARQARVGLVPKLDGCDAELAGVLRRALGALPGDRHHDAAVMRDAFEAILDREPRARSAARAELVARTAASSAASDSGAQTEGSALPTRDATREPRPARARVWVAAALLVAAGGLGAAKLIGRRSPEPTTATTTGSTTRAPTSAAPPSAPISPSAAPTVTTPTATAPLITPARAPATAANAPASERNAPARSAPPRAFAHREPAPPPSAPGTLDVNATPWAHVRIDGEPRGETPLLGVVLAPGAHKLELINEPLGARRELSVEVHAGEHLRRIEDLTRP